jgi:AraC-like DNA-binding protein
MDFVLHEPGGSLRALVQSIWVATLDAADRDVPGLIAPDAHAEFVFHLGAPCRMQRAPASAWEAQPSAMLFAQRHGCVRLRSGGPGDMIGFRTSAVVASLLLDGRCNMRELWDRPVALTDLFGRDFDLPERLASAAPARRVELLEDWLRARLDAWCGEHAERERLHAELVWRSAGAPIARQAREWGLSARSLRRWIDDATGLSPKQLELSGRVLRGCALLRERADLTVTGIAHRLGFADHAAFTTAFGHLTRLTPQAIRAEPLVFYERGPG